MVMSNVCGTSVWDLLHVTFLGPRLLFKWPHIFGKFVQLCINGTAAWATVLTDLTQTVSWLLPTTVINMKIYGGTEVRLLSFITWILNGVE